MTVSTTVTDQRGWFKATITGAAGTTGGAIGSFANPEGVLLGITRAFFYFRTGSTGAANLAVGVAATATTSDADLFGTSDCIEATVGGKMVYGPTAQIAVTQNPVTLWTSTTYVTVTGSGSTVGLDADLYLEYIRLA